ncbi:MAG: hypothetical protein COY47_05590 [Chloroflexi bacterium CG_4_10_14_0_8_um_filter_57_5]|nr:MAG: hypothetical protein COY47_05590 [Chloroflexi bacterium CG_4_10_14_0_8_um_filter_57_5]
MDCHKITGLPDNDLIYMIACIEPPPVWKITEPSPATRIPHLKLNRVKVKERAESNNPIAAAQHVI